MLSILIASLLLFVPLTQSDETDSIAEARLLFERGETELALRLLEERVAAIPSDDEAWTLLGKMHREVAAECIAANADPLVPLQESRAALERSLELDPHDLDTLAVYVDACDLLGDFGPIVAVTENTSGHLYLRDRAVPSWLIEAAAGARARLLMERNPGATAEFVADFAHALDAMNHAAGRIGPRADFVGLQADLLHWAGVYSLAVDVLGEALRALPGEVDLHRRFIDLHYYPQTVYRLPAFYADLSAAHPADPAVAWFRGYAELLAGDLARKERRLDEARAHYESCSSSMDEAILLSPGWAESSRIYTFRARVGLGWCALRGNDLEGAGGLFLAALEAAPDLLEEQDGLGRSLLDAVGRFEAEAVANQRLELALDLARRIAEVVGTDAQLYNNLGLLLRDHATQVQRAALEAAGDEGAAADDPAEEIFEESWRAYLEAVALAPRNARIVNDAALIQVYHLRTELDRARAMLFRAIEIGEEQLAALGAAPDEAERYSLALAVGDTWQNLGYLAQHVDNDFDKAAEYYRASITTNSGPRPAVHAALDEVTGKKPPSADPYSRETIAAGLVRAADSSDEAAADSRGRAQRRSYYRRLSMVRTELVWEPSFLAGRERARRENRPLMVYYRPDGLADAVAYLDRVIAIPGFAHLADGVVCVIADTQRYTYVDRRGDGRPVWSMRYGKVACSDHIRAAEEFLASWPELRREAESANPEEGLYFFTPEGERFEPEAGLEYDFNALFEGLREKSGEPRPDRFLDLLTRQIAGTDVPSRLESAALLLDTPGRPARERLEELLFDGTTPRTGRAALVDALGARGDDYSLSLHEALVRQYVDAELALLALEAWPTGRSHEPVLYALHWSPHRAVRAAAAIALARTGTTSEVRRILLARLVACGEAERVDAARALGFVRELVLGALVARVDREPCASVRVALCNLLAGVEDGEARATLSRLSECDPHVKVRAAAARAIGD